MKYSMYAAFHLGLHCLGVSSTQSVNEMKSVIFVYL